MRDARAPRTNPIESESAAVTGRGWSCRRVRRHHGTVSLVFLAKLLTSCASRSGLSCAASCLPSSCFRLPRWQMRRPLRQAQPQRRRQTRARRRRQSPRCRTPEPRRCRNLQRRALRHHQTLARARAPSQRRGPPHRHQTSASQHRPPARQTGPRPARAQLPSQRRGPRPRCQSMA